MLRVMVMLRVRIGVKFRAGASARVRTDLLLFESRGNSHAPGI